MKVEEFLKSIVALLSRGGPRILIGLVGKPGVGKSTLVEKIKNQFSGD